MKKESRERKKKVAVQTYTAVSEKSSDFLEENSAAFDIRYVRMLTQSNF